MHACMYDKYIITSDGERGVVYSSDWLVLPLLLQIICVNMVTFLSAHAQ